LREKLTEAVIYIIALAVVGRVVFELLAPALPVVVGLLVLSYVLIFLLRRL
jgi:hypothetical protein